jgi:hypothetical protein
LSARIGPTMIDMRRCPTRGSHTARTTMDAHHEATAAAAGLGDTLLERLGGRAKAEAVFGAPVLHSEVPVIPVARVRWGLGAGGGEDRRADGASSGSGGAGGVAADPGGYIEIGSAGAAFRPIGHAYANPGFILAAALAAGIVIRALGRLRG